MNNSEAEHHTQTGPFSDPRDYLLSVMNDRCAPTDIRVEAAQALMPYFHAELGQEQGE